jgi:POT family proton-dependent oligopeptide transporter
MSSTIKHPKGLYYLFFAEMWERFGYYLMIGIFVLYMTGDKTAGGLGLELANASDIYGTFIALVFLTPFLGGLLADRKLGYRTSITIGGIMMGVGYCLLAVKGEIIFYIALILIIVGNGFFKPNISTLLGNLYSTPEYKDKKDAGYNIFYMGINIGAFICNFFAAYLRHNFGWGYAFMGAGIGMFVGVIIFWVGMKHYKHADTIKPVNPEDSSLTKIVGVTILPALVAGVIGWIIPGNIFGTDSTDAFIFGALPVAYFYFSLYKKASTEDKEPIGALLAIFAVVIIFWAVFKQNGTALTTWAEKYTDRSLPASIAPTAEKIKMVQIIEGKKDSVFVTDNQFRKIKDENGNPIKEFGLNSYFKNEFAEKIPAETEKTSLISTELFQSVNPGWVVLLTPLVVIFFSFLRSKGKEPSTPAKIGWGLFISALSTLVMVAAVYACGNGATKASPWWLISSYGVITIGELFLSPMGLSLVSKLSPPRLTALMMGGWFLSTSIGNKLSGVLATLWDNYDNKALYFLVNFILLILASVSIFMMLKWLRKIITARSN